MNYQELIDAALQHLEINRDDVSIVQINYHSRTVTIINHQMQKFVTPFPPEPQLTKRTKMVKRTS